MLQNAIRTVRTLLPQGAVTFSEIETAVDSVLLIPLYAEVDRAELIREIQSVCNIRIDDYRIIEAEERRRPWLSENRTGIRWTFWSRYQEYLETEKNYSPAVLSQLDKLTDRTLDSLFNPSMQGRISKYGLVVGQVQSGKTSNYTGLICKAADAGFKLIIVLAGIHNNLRSQTQLRIDEGFLGFDTQHQRAFHTNGVRTGVGFINQHGVAHSLTSSLERGDFSAGAANSLGINFNTNEPIIAVVKKNSSVLNRLCQWLSAQGAEGADGRRTITSKSLLLIDDEADNASINTNRENDNATRINTQIRTLIGLFDKSAYVGYTATPFANIFIPLEEDQLFPRDFIINIPAPSNYIGPRQIFGIRVPVDDEENLSTLPVVNRIDDFHAFIPEGHRSNQALPDEIPPSLQRAIRCFILTCAVRRLRGQQNAHNSMLIHVTRFTAWQSHIKELVEQTFDFYRRGIEMNMPLVMQMMQDTFCTDDVNYRSYQTVSRMMADDASYEHGTAQVHSWEEVHPHLVEAVSRIQVREINGGSGDVLNYYDHRSGLSVIAVGGNKLSRGLTLEGLSVSYYLRASRMYDTLMQMGRWFGYRPGYADLCRIFLSRELNEWFCHITLASEELRTEFNYMADVAGSTPEQYALRVRTHPGVLQISASNKIRRVVNVEVSWAGRLIETYLLSRRPEIIHSNLMATQEFITSLGGDFTEGRNYYLWHDVQVSQLRPFMNTFRVAESLKTADPANLLQYIEMQERNGELNSWNVAVITTVRRERLYTFSTPEHTFKIGTALRNSAKDKENEELYYIGRNHIIDPKDEFIDLTEEQYERAMEITRELYREKNKEYTASYPSGEVVRNEIRDPSRPLLLLYFLSPEGAGLPAGSEPFTGFAVSFPGSRHNQTITYAVHEQLLPFFDVPDYDEPDETTNDED